MNVFEIDASYINNNYSFLSTFFSGLSDSFLLALPLSVPLLISLRRLLVQGVGPGLFCYLGTAFGYTFVIFLVIFGFSNIIQLWYDWEPILFFIGAVLSLKLLFQFYADQRLEKRADLLLPKLLTIAFQNFVIVLLNPSGILNFSSLITTQQFIESNSIILYLFSFFIGLFVFSCLFGFSFYFLRNFIVSSSLKPYRALMEMLNKGIIIFSFSLILYVTSSFTWELFLYYPAEKILSTIQIMENLLPESIREKKSLRDFPIFQSNVESSVYIQVQRHFPVESIQEQRSWSNKPPLEESKLNTIYLKYNMHFLNRFGEWVHQKRIELRTPLSKQETPEQLTRLKQVQSDYLQLQSIVGPRKMNFQANEVTNQAKGNGTVNYVEPRGTEPSVMAIESDLQWSKQKVKEKDFRSFFVLYSDLPSK